MDRRAVAAAAVKKKKKREREEEEEADEAADFCFDDAAADVGEAWRRPPGVFKFPWQNCRGGLGVAGGGWELRDVFFHSLVDGGAATIGVPGDRLVSPPPTGQHALLEGVDAWLASAAAGEVDPIWRSAIVGWSCSRPGRVTNNVARPSVGREVAPRGIHGSAAPTSAS